MRSNLSRSHPSYFRRLAAALRFLLLFLRALILSNLQMAGVVLFRRRADLAPGFVPYPIAGLTSTELLILSHCITLTPGTTSVEISAERTELLLHALDARDPATVVSSIKRDLEEPLLAWTR